MTHINNLLDTSRLENGGGRDAIRHALSSLRTHLGMEVAYVSQFVGNDTVFREVDAPGLESVIKPGDSRSLDDVYCRHILSGQLPELIPDTSQNEFARSLPITRESHIGSHLSVPIRMDDGHVYGMFCCLGFSPDPSLNTRDIQMMRLFADMTARQLNQEAASGRTAREKRGRIEAVLLSQDITIVFQPIWDLAEQRPIGFEALSRFKSEPYRSPDIWFREADEAGLGIELEIMAIEHALAAGADLPPDLYLSVNASPNLIASGRLTAVFVAHAGCRIVLEVTEHAPVDDYAALIIELDILRKLGALIAIDDAGAGYAGLQHIVQLRPDMIKLDIALVRQIETDSSKRALIAALLFFAREIGCMIVAEGIETGEALAMLRVLGVNKGQGYLFGKPMPLDQAIHCVAPPVSVGNAA